MDWLLTHAFRIGRISGINVLVHITFLFWIGFDLLNCRSMAEVQLTAVFGGMFFLSVLLHEFGHCYGARSVGGDAENIVMWPLGGLAYVHAPMRPWPQFVTTIMGPAVNFVLALVSWVILALAHGTPYVFNFNPFNADFLVPLPGWQWWVAQFLWVNYWLFTFNMCLLMYPFDCARLVHVLLWKFVGLQTATMWICQISMPFAVLFGLYGISRNSPTTVAIAIMGGLTSFQQYMAAKHGYVYEDRTPVIRNRRPGWWSRLKDRFGSAAGRSEEASPRNPNPGGWQRKIDEEQRLEAEVDRILAKVKEQGMSSLSYVERQTLEQATRRKRQAEEKSFDRELRL